MSHTPIEVGNAIHEAFETGQIDTSLPLELRSYQRKAIEDLARPSESPSLYFQQVGRITRAGTSEFQSCAEAFRCAELAAHNGQPVKLGKNPGEPWKVTVEPRP